MTEELKAQATQADAPAPSPPQAGQTPPTETPPPVGAKPSLSAEDLAKELEDTRREAAKYRTERKTLADQLSQFKAELEKLQTANLTEQERKDKEYQRAQQQTAELAAKLAETEKRNRELHARSLVQAAATRLGVVDPDAAYVLLRDSGTVEPDETGQFDPKKIETAVRELVKAKSYLLAAPQTSAANPAKTETVQRETDEQKRARLMGGGFNIFDADHARKRGGGVVWGDKTVGGGS